MPAPHCGLFFGCGLCVRFQGLRAAPCVQCARPDAVTHSRKSIHERSVPAPQETAAQPG
ncbi:hypothetical protein KPSA3_04852 [Pseudomonas syringae pv. actinidiae]|uniref:Uncharacterized protein n=1 Tax=Pseudomonas syringae pv. actinidiae TaxID=103796 RepID=A0AAN4Q877_PSESF|nr:hypothetical protein KPSA3_04852 [Pseudomonas syringae pv. actinidiae]